MSRRHGITDDPNGLQRINSMTGFKQSFKRLAMVGIATTLIVSQLPTIAMAERRNLIAHPRTSYQFAFYKRHRRSYRVASALHFAHSKLHDVLLLTPFSEHAKEDDKLYQQVLRYYNKPPKIEPPMELFAPYAARATWRLFRTIDSVHLLHEMTEDVMSDADITWDQKEQKLRETYDYYRKTYKDIALSPAPLDVTMRRAGVMMKPYFTLTRNYYPKNNNFFYAAHWWHPALYETMMVSGNGKAQDQLMSQMEDLFRDQVVPEPPLRMLLSRELSPRYSRLSPETANVFDNLHMLHGITYDIFAFEGWTIKQKRAELYRVLDAMTYQPGDETLVRKFELPNPDINPLNYDQWAQSADGEMTRMMVEMLDEMMPLMMQHHGVTSIHTPGRAGPDTQHNGQHPQHHSMHHQETQPDGTPKPAQGSAHHQAQVMSPEMAAMHQHLRAQLRLKLTPGLQEGELPGSFMDAIRQLMPHMQAHSGMEPGRINLTMINAMLKGWQAKYGSLPDVESMPMDVEPSGIALGQ